MLVQLQHQFKDGRTELLAQREIKSTEIEEEMRLFILNIKERFPLPEGAQYLAVVEGSEFFKYMAAPNQGDQHV
jgi:hypothetical protein